MSDKQKKSKKSEKIPRVAGNLLLGDEETPPASSNTAGPSTSRNSAASTSKKAKKRSAEDDGDSSSAKKVMRPVSERGQQDPTTNAWVCAGCGKNFVLKKDLNRHFLSIHENHRPYVCLICSKAFKESHHLSSHVAKVHKNERKYKCDQCEKDYKTEIDLKRHVKEKHDNIRDIICPQCNMSFMKINHLTQHIKSVHEEVKDYACFYCDQKFSMKTSLRKHMENIHFDMKNHECEDCQRKFYEKSAFVKHQRQRTCRFCDFSSNCFQLHVDHEAQHSFVCHKCDRFYDKVGPAKEHAKRHLKITKGIGKLKKRSESSHTHNDNPTVDINESSKCYFCDDDENAFEFEDPVSFIKHLKDSHSDINVCDACGGVFESRGELQVHLCSGNFDGNIVKCLNVMLKSPDLEEIEQQQISSCFTDENGIINHIIPGWPLQATCSIDASRNLLKRTQCEGSTSFSINQAQNVIQNGSSAILNWCSEINSLSYAIEKIEWTKDSKGNAIMKPRFNRRNICFKKDEQDVLYGISSKRLMHPYDLGHAHAAGNCFTMEDFVASFSNLNFWPMHHVLNQNYWRVLETRILDQAKLFKCAYVTTGAIFSKSGQIVSKYINGILIPCAFFKVAVFERYDGQYVIKSYMMGNNGSVQSVPASEVSLLLIEKITKRFYLTPSVLAKVLPASLKDHIETLRRFEDPNMM